MSLYDRVRYTTHSDPDTHPDRFAVIGALFGLDPAPVTRCRVLEVGCGDGNNLIPMAWSLPESEFVGIDLAAGPVESGGRIIGELGIANARLVNADLMSVDDNWGKFDYIVAHGFYSWVPAEVREHLMSVCSRSLSAHGIAFISYNAYPGSHLRALVRDMMRFHVKNVSDPSERIRQARALLSLLTHAPAGRPDAEPLVAEARRTLEHTDVHMYHDDLAPVSQPFYFHEFMEHAAAHGLQYLGEADYFEMSDHVLPDPSRAALDGIRGNRLLYEQYLDFMKCRRFRQTLLCHADVAVRAAASPDAMPRMLLSSTAAESPGGPNGSTSVFTTAKGARVETDHVAGAEALRELQRRSPAAIRFEELADIVAQRLSGLDSGVSSRELADFLLRIYSAGVVELHTYLPPTAASDHPRPMASPVARMQAAKGRSVTTLLHDSLHIEDPVEKQLIAMLDGRRDRLDLRNDLYEFLREQGAFADGIPPEKCREQVGLALERNLEKLARLGLLVGSPRV